MAEHEPGEWSTLSLPVFRECLETNVLGEDDAPELVGVLQEILVSAFRPAIFNGGQHVYAATPKLIRDRLRHMHIHVERHRHLQHPPGSQAQEERRARRLRLILLHVPPLRLDLIVYLVLMVEVVRHRGMSLGRAEVRMLTAHLVR